VRVECWYTLHFEDAPKRPLDGFRVQRLHARGTRRDPGVVWLGWGGETPLEIATGWHDYLPGLIIQHAPNRVFVFREVAADNRQIKAAENAGIALSFEQKFE